MNVTIHSWRRRGAMVLLALALAACGGTAATTTGSGVTTGQGAAATSAPAPTTAGQDTAVTTAPAADSGATAPAAAKLNLNTVTGDELLAAIPNFGNRMVREFEEYRPYVSIAQFRKEIGKYVSQEQVAEYEKYVYVPVDIDSADAATLQQLPGVDAATADQLIAARPYGSAEAFLSKLAALVPAADAAAAAAYLAN
jgi:DNA uptake protein ComE-like DNA-binding protein